MAKNSLSLETMKILMKASNENTMAVMIMTISKCPEFGEIQLRKGEKKDLNNLNQSKGPQSIRFPMKGKIKDKFMKINSLIQATFDSIAIPNYLAAETATILQTGRRLAKGLYQISLRKNNYYALICTAILLKCFRADRFNIKLPFLKLLGNKYAAALVKAGLIKLDLIASANPSKIEALLSRRPPFGNQICDAAATFPRFAIDVKQKIDSHKERSCLTLSITVLNAKTLQRLNRNGIVPSTTLLVIGSNSEILYCREFSTKFLVTEVIHQRDIILPNNDNISEIYLDLINLTYVGLDIHKRMKLAHAFQMSQPNCNGKNFQTEETLLAMSSNQLEKILSNNSSESKQKAISQTVNCKGTTLLNHGKRIKSQDHNRKATLRSKYMSSVANRRKSLILKGTKPGTRGLEFQKYHIEQEDHGSCFTNLHQMYEAMD
ncbi:putative ATP-dependent DNA helicase HFM1 [Trichoplax sp. H2]|nr:putative ATP-dependent DNA helicase HFM1 [Trichoplax sp. H2]|eukprot:RDD43015.1 putative ATP-dependent DNA helicase HFM1 [Trichoplax sp. H2]